MAQTEEDTFESDDELDEDYEDALERDDELDRAPQPGNTPAPDEEPYDEGAITSYPDESDSD